MIIPNFATKKELFDFLVTNKDKIVAAKKAAIKHADPAGCDAVGINVNKAIAGNDPDTIKVTAIINTTNLMDSHKDVHLPGIWNKSVKENKNIMHLQEHKMEFDKIIADGDDLKAYVKEYTWKELGFNMEGKTEALVFESSISKDRNNYMFNQYSKQRVKNHSVGMMYVKMLLAVNDKAYAAEYDAWEKYYPEIANKKDADAAGYFWAVKEAKAIEGSAVPLGSNWATPTLSTESKSTPNEEPPTIEPSGVDTQKIDYLKLTKHLNL